MQWKPKKIMTIDLVVFFFSSLSLSAFLPDSIHARFLSVPLSRFVVVRHKNAVIRQHLELYCLSIEYFCPGTWSLNQIALETAMGKWTRTEGTTCVSCFCYDRKLWDFFFWLNMSVYYDDVITNTSVETLCSWVLVWCLWFKILYAFAPNPINYFILYTVIY